MAGGNLTPRQKMINMMYLVLTAMLALNVSAEVLSAFVLIDNGINQSTTIIREKNVTDLNAFTQAMSQNHDKVEKWKNKADSVHLKTVEFDNYLYELKIKIIQAGDGEDSKALADSLKINIGAIDSKDNTDAASRIMLGEMQSGEAYTLRKKLNVYKDFLLGYMNKESSAAKSIEKMLQTEDPPITADGTHLTWESKFESLPLISAVALLSMQQMDIASCESEVLSYLRNQVDAADFKFSNIDVAIIPSSKYVIKGTEYSAEIFLAAYDPSQRPVLTIGGRTYGANDKGKIDFKYPAESVGPKNIPGTVEFIGPDGKTTKPVNLIFDVAEPNVVISPTKMNVVYREIDNPLSISLSGVSPDRLEPKASSGTITKTGNQFFVRPGDGRTCDVSVYLDGKSMGTISFRIKDVPKPIPAIFGISGKTVSKGELQVAEGVVAEMKDFDFDFKYKVTEFTVGISIDNYVQEADSKSDRFTDKQKNLFNSVKSGQYVMVTKIKAVSPTGRVIDLNDYAIKVK